MSRITRLLTFLVLFTGATYEAPAQNQGDRPGGTPSGSLSGTVLDAETGDPVETATVAVWSATDSSLVTGAVSTPGGDFLIEGLRPGRYYVRVSFIGYATETVDEVALSRENRHAALGAIRLTPDTAQLGEVQVSAERDFMEVHIDKTVYNTKDQLVAIGGSATDVLRNIPSVEVDMDGSVSLRGSQNVAILINGRPSQMNGEMLASFLEGLPSSTIERVEVIPNPSARYEPDGMSGILNIVLKQDADLGLSGSVTAGAGTQDNYNLSGMLGYGKGPFNARVNYGFRTRTRASEGARFNEYRFQEPSDYLETLNAGSRSSLSHMLRANLDYRLGPRNTVSLSGLVSTRGGDSDELNTYAELDALQAVTRRYDRRSSESGNDLNMDYRLSFSRVIEPAKHELSAELRYEREWEDEFEEYMQQVLNPDVALPGPAPELETTVQDELSSDLSLQLDYLRPLGEGKLEAGYKGSLQQLGSDYYAEWFDHEHGTYVPDVAQNNTFAFDEQVHAAYGILGQQFGPVGVQVGLRLEQALTTFDLTTTGEAYENNYFSAFPNAYVTYKFNDMHQVRGSYSKRTNRPRTWSLNPFSSNDDPLYRRVGNPYLKPEYVHGFELSYTQTLKQTTLTLSPYFRRTVDEIRRYTSMDESGVTTLTFENFATSDSYGAEAIGSLRLGDRFRGYASFNVYRVVTDGSNVEASLSNNALGWTTRLNGTFTVTPTLDMQLSFFYRAPMNIEQGRVASFSRSDIALRQRLFDNRASLSLRVNDPFGTSGFSLWRDTPNYYLETSRQWDSRTVNLTFTYNFGRQDRRDNRRDDQRERGGEDFDAVEFE